MCELGVIVYMDGYLTDHLIPASDAAPRHLVYDLPIRTRDVTDSESDGIRHFFRNPKSDGYLKSDRIGFKIFVSVQL